MSESEEPRVLEIVWTYYREAGYGSHLRVGTLTPIFTYIETRATHKSCDGGDTIERIKEIENE